MINLEILVNGILLGGLYGLMASGFSLIYGVGKVVNLAYGHIFMVAVYMMYLMTVSWKLNFLVAFPLTLLITVFLGIGVQYLLERVALSHLRVLFLSVGLATILENLLLAYFGGVYRFVPSPIPGLIDIGGIRLQTYWVITFASTLLIYVALSAIIASTYLGKSLRAVSQNEEASWLMGIDVRKIKILAGGIASALASIAATFILPIYPICPHMGWTYLLFGFAIVVLGGMGSILGTLMGGVILGMCELLFGYYISSGLRGILFFLTIVIVISIRPEGLLGKRKVK